MVVNPSDRGQLVLVKTANGTKLATMRNVAGLRVFVVVTFALAVGCQSTGGGNPGSAPDAADGCTQHLQPSGNVQVDVQHALMNAAAGSTLCFDDGTYLFTDELAVSTPNITVHGTANGAVWDFRNQSAPARSGLFATGNGFTISNLTIKNTAGDGVRAEGATGVAFQNLKVLWETDTLRIDDAGVARSGEYAVYPVNCTNVIIEGCDVSGARDSALYIGQSTKGIVRNNTVHGNVAGIEIENSTDCEVYRNHTYDNSAGILVFNLPDLAKEGGARASIHDNVSESNNRPNFAAPGQTVGGVPVGTGVLIMAAAATEVRNNTIQDNNSAGVLIVSCFTNNNLQDCTSSTPGYYEWPEASYVHDNTFMMNGASPDPLFVVLGQSTLFDIMWDGDVNPAKASDPAIRQCIVRNGGATFENFDSRDFFKNKSNDLTPNQCEYTTQPPIAF
jgi:parallel beta-helix repeat protein